MPFQLCYASTATREMQRNELLDLLTAARKHNAAIGVTGLLLFQGKHFLQGAIQANLHGPPARAYRAPVRRAGLGASVP